MFKELRLKIKRAFAIYELIQKHKDTPKLSKFLPWLALIYLILPSDFIPDIIPILGQIDDILIIPTLLTIAYKMIPKEIIKDVIDKLNRKDNK